MSEAQRAGQWSWYRQARNIKDAEQLKVGAVSKELEQRLGCKSPISTFTKTVRKDHMTLPYARGLLCEKHRLAAHQDTRFLSEPESWGEKNQLKIAVTSNARFSFFFLFFFPLVSSPKISLQIFLPFKWKRKNRKVKNFSYASKKPEVFAQTDGAVL